MVTNVSVQYNGGLLPDVILLTLCYYHLGTHLNATKRFCICSLLSYLNVLTFFPLTGGCSEGMGAFRLFFEHWGIRLYPMNSFCPYSQCSHLTRFDNFSICVIVSRKI